MQHKNTKQLITNTLTPKNMGNHGKPPVAARHKELKNPVAARHAPDSYPGRDITSCDEGSYTKSSFIHYPQTLPPERSGPLTLIKNKSARHGTQLSKTTIPTSHCPKISSGKWEIHTTQTNDYQQLIPYLNGNLNSRLWAISLLLRKLL